MEKIDWNQKVQEALDRTEFMVISTIGLDGSWTCPVQFGFSESLDLYFMSMQHSKHIVNLQSDNRVSLAIVKTERFEDGEVLGLQLKGIGVCLTNKEDVEEACRCYYGKDPRQLDYKEKTIEHLGDSAEWNFFKITPTEAWCFDSRVFGDERVQIPIEELSLRVGVNIKALSV